MKNNKTYKTLAGAYTAAEKAGAVRFTNEAYYTQVCLCIANAIKGGKDANKIALWNLVKYENTLCALECTKEKTFQWTAIGCFDNEGLLYPMHKAEKPTEAQTEDKPTPKKARARKAAQGKGDPKPTKAEWQIGIDTYAGKGREANKAVASVLRKHNMSAQIGSEGWTYWESVR